MSQVQINSVFQSGELGLKGSDFLTFATVFELNLGGAAMSSADLILLHNSATYAALPVAARTVNGSVLTEVQYNDSFYASRNMKRVLDTIERFSTVTMLGAVSTIASGASGPTAAHIDSFASASDIMAAGALGSALNTAAAKVYCFSFGVEDAQCFRSNAGVALGNLLTALSGLPMYATTDTLATCIQVDGAAAVGSPLLGITSSATKCTFHVATSASLQIPGHFTAV